MLGTYALLENGEVVLRERVCLCDDWDEVDASTEALHHLDIKRLEPTRQAPTESAPTLQTRRKKRQVKTHV